MQEQIVEFVMDVSHGSIKRAAMRVVWMFSGVSLVDINEKGILKVKGIFDKMEMMRKLSEIDDSVVIITGGPRHSFIIPPKVRFVVKFDVFDEGIIHDAMEVFWEFSGVTSVEVKGDDVQLGMNGDFDKIVMATKLKDIDENVSVSFMDGPDDDEVEQLSEDF